MIDSIFSNPYAPLAVLLVPSVILLGVFLLKNGRTLKALDTKIDSIEDAINEQPKTDPSLVEKINAMGDEQVKVAEDLAAFKKADRTESKVDELLQHDRERDQPGLRYGKPNPPEE